tara:strand:- start:230 stop:424 length:195 start_codon:yes stop_codon:yes gene_type:complete
MGRHGPSAAADQALASHHGVPTARGGSFAELERTRVLRAILHCVQHCVATRAAGASSALQGQKE